MTFREEAVESGFIYIFIKTEIKKKLTSQSVFSASSDGLAGLTAHRSHSHTKQDHVGEKRQSERKQTAHSIYFSSLFFLLIRNNGWCCSELDNDRIHLFVREGKYAQTFHITFSF